MELINKILSGGIVPIAVIGMALYFLIILRGRPLSNPIKMMRALFSKKRTSGISPTKAVILALAGTLGVGNIVGVSSAIVLGGVGAVFWMWVSAFFAMILKYGEVVLSVRHRRSREDGFFGGAMYYMRDYFHSCHKNRIGSVFSLVFTLFCFVNGITMGCMIQANSISSAISSSFGFDKVGIGLALMLVCVVVFFFNGKRIFSLCERAVPIVSGIYILMSLMVIVDGCERIPIILEEIITDAFSFASVGGGVFGFFASRAIRYGTIRGLFSNEAGCGTSPIAHATANTDSACKQGILGIVEVFIDTIVVCTMTAFVILLGGDKSTDPMLCVLYSFEHVLGEGAGAWLGICVALFGFATIVCWGYYGKECTYYLCKTPRAEKIYYLIYVCFVFVGSFVRMDLVWELADFAVGIMTVMNLYILLMMSKEIKLETTQYFNKKGLPKGSPKSIK